MGDIQRFKKFEEFVTSNEDFLDTNPMLYYFLTATIKRVLKGETTLFKFFNIVGENNNRLILLFVKDACLVYGNNFDIEMISQLSEELEFPKFKRYQFAGTKQTLDALFKFNQAEYSLQKHRIIYKCTEVKRDFIYSAGEMAMGDMNKLEELSKFSVGFNEDYFGEKKDINSMKEIIFNGIINDIIYQWNFDKKICSIAQAIHGDYDFPVIGHFYSNPDFRNLGFGSSLIHKLTKGLLDVGHECCMLSTNALTPASNKVFIKVGYENTGEYLLAYKEKF